MAPRACPLPESRAGIEGVAFLEVADQASAHVIDAPGHDDFEDEEEVPRGLPRRARARGGDPLPAEPKLLPARAARGNRQGLPALQGRYLHPGAEDRFADG